MQFTKLVAVAAAFAVTSAQTYRFTDVSFTGITVGQSFNITWEPTTDVVTIKLKSGLATAQTLVSTIVSGASGGSFSWVPTSDTVPGQMYNLEIDHGSDLPNYSVQFTIAGGSGSSSSSVASVVSTTTVTSGVSMSTSSGTASSTSSGSSTGSATGSSTSTKGTATASKTSATTSSPTTNAAAQYASPFAFALMSFFAIAALN